MTVSSNRPGRSTTGLATAAVAALSASALASMVWVGAGALVGAQRESPAATAGGSSLVPRQVDLGPLLLPARKGHAVASTTGGSTGGGGSGPTVFASVAGSTSVAGSGPTSVAGSGPTVFAPVARRIDGGATATNTPPLPAPGQGSPSGNDSPTLGRHGDGQSPRGEESTEQPAAGGAAGLGLHVTRAAAEPAQGRAEPGAKPGRTGGPRHDEIDPDSSCGDGALQKAAHRIRRAIAAAERTLDPATSRGAPAKHSKAASSDGPATHHYLGKHRKG